MIPEFVISINGYNSIRLIIKSRFKRAMNFYNFYFFYMLLLLKLDHKVFIFI